MPFEPGQLTRESERITVRRLEQAREELDAETRSGELEPERRCPDCNAKLTVQIFPHGYESKCGPCERRARFDGADS